MLCQQRMCRLGFIYLRHSAASLSTRLSVSLRHKEAEAQEKLLIIPIKIILMEIIMMVRIIVLILFVLRHFLFCMLTPCNTLFQIHLVIQLKMCLCLFLIFRIKRRKKKRVVLMATVSSTSFHAVLSSSVHQSKKHTVSTRAFLCVSSRLRRLLCLSSLRLFFALIIIIILIMFCVLFSVSQLFVPFSVSSLSLLGPCVEGGQCCLSPRVVSFRYYIEFNDII